MKPMIMPILGGKTVVFQIASESLRWSASIVVSVVVFSIAHAEESVASNSLPSKRYDELVRDEYLAPIVDIQDMSLTPINASQLRRAIFDPTVALLGEVPNEPSIVIQAQAITGGQPFDPGTSRSVGLTSAPSFSLGALDERLSDQIASTPTTGTFASDQGPSQTSTESTERATPQSLISTPAVDIVSSSEIKFLGASESAEILGSSQGVQSVDIQRRSPIDFDPRIRGYRAGQVFTQADGAQWFPARQDLDSIMSKLDPSLIQDMIVIPGPYGLRYGPGFGFVDIVTSPTPRYKQGPEWHSRTGVTVRENGGQLYGRETLFGGSNDWGFILNYGNRTGADYESGNGRQIPSSYQAQNLLGQIGFDVGEDSSLEFRALRLDQTDTEYAAQFFDLNFLVTDGYSLNFVNESPTTAWTRFEFHSWYNRTRFGGDTEGEDTFNVIDRVEAALGGAEFFGQTDGDLTSSGLRSQLTFGEDGEEQLRAGADFRYLKQSLNELFQVGSAMPFRTNLPRSRSFDPGLFAELTVPLHEFWLTTVGARVDWVHMSALADDIRPDTSLPGIMTASSQNDILYAFYLVNEIQLTQDWKSRIGIGHAQRAPIFVERYADGVFLGIIQSGFSRVIGNPHLEKERLWQIDASVSGQLARWNVRLAGFQAWIDDYVTFTGNVINDPSGARLLRTVNTDLATLAGGEFYLERTCTERLSAFGSLQYVDGRDREIDRPLSGISPLEGRAGLRYIDRSGGTRWGVEVFGRMVNDQDRLGALRIGTTTVADIIDLEVPTPGFTTFHLRSYYNVTESLHVVLGIDNIFDRNYLEHLSLRLPDQGIYKDTAVFEPGFSPFVSMELTY